MNFIARHLEKELKQAARYFPAVILTGPRRTGKTTLLRKCFPAASYYLMEDTDMIARIKSDPRAFMDEIRLPVILDEIQNVPEIFNYVRSKIDHAPQKAGQWILTGSQEPILMRGVTESMAGRAAILHLWPLSLEESPKVSLSGGGFPEAVAKPKVSTLWFNSYIQTYLERDVRAISSIRDLATFRRFLSLVASRVGQMLNRSDIAAPLGVSVPTLSEWLNILEITQQILLVPPFYENFGKRIVKSPKIYFSDTGLLCHLLGIENDGELARSPFLGPIFENFVAAEIVKKQINHGKRRELYYFRDRQGLEVDFVIPIAGRKLFLLEAKASKTPLPKMVEPIERLKKCLKGVHTDSFLIYQASSHVGEAAIEALAPGVKALPLHRFLEKLS